MKRFCISIAVVLMCFSGAWSQEPDYAASIQTNEVVTTYQYLSPIQLTATEYNLQILRSSCATDEDYLMGLRYLQGLLTEDKNKTQHALATLKTERALYEAQMELYKDRKALAATINKQTTGLVKDINELIRSMDKEYELLKKLEDGSEAMQSQQSRTDQLKRELYDQFGKVNQMKQRASNSGDDIIHKEFERLNAFLIELTDKQTRLGSIQNQTKANLDIINTAIRKTEASIKAAAKGK